MFDRIITNNGGFGQFHRPLVSSFCWRHTGRNAARNRRTNAQGKTFVPHSFSSAPKKHEIIDQVHKHRGGYKIKFVGWSSPSGLDLSASLIRRLDSKRRRRPRFAVIKMFSRKRPTFWPVKWSSFRSADCQCCNQKMLIRRPVPSSFPSFSIFCSHHQGQLP